MSAHLPSRHQLGTVTAGLVIAACFGLMAGYSPLIALGVALAAVLAVVMFRDLVIAIAVFTLGSFGSALSGGHAASGSKALGFLLVLAWMGALARRPRGEALALLREQRWLVVFAAALLGWSVLSAAWADSASTALSGSGRWLLDLVLFPIICTGIRNTHHVRIVMGAFVAGAILAVLYGAATGSTVAGSRLAGAVGDPNETAAVMCAAFIVALALGASERNSRKLRWVAYVTALASLIGLAATASRGGLIALGVAMVAAVFMAGRWRRQAAMAVGIGAVLVVGWFALLAPSSSVSHLSTLQTGRTTLWLVAGRTIEANPLVGVGGDNFALTSSQYLLRPGVTTAADQIITTPKVAHNAYLEIWADLGIVGVVLFGAVIIAALGCVLKAAKLLERAGRRAEEIMARGLFVAIIAMLAADFFMSDLYDKQLFVLLALAPAMLVAARAEVRADPELQGVPELQAEG